MSFIAGCTVVGLAWLVQEEPPAPQVQAVINEVAAAETSLPEGPLSFDEWANDIAEANRHAVIGLLLGGTAEHDMAQAIMLSTDGHLLTSAHALMGAENITAKVPGADRPSPVTFVASDPVSGVAVLKINAPDLPPPVFADDRSVLVSDVLVALANHGEDTDSLARTVSVLGDEQVAAAANGDLLSGLFRLSDDLGPEWAGSAVLEESGGIVAMTVENQDGRHHAIPIGQARQYAQQLIDTGTVEYKAWLGVEFATGLSPAIMERRQLLGGVLFSRVWNETPAAQGGLVAGDIIIGAGPVNVIDKQDLSLYLATLQPGDSVEFRFNRAVGSGVGPDTTTPDSAEIETEILTTTVVVGARPA